MRILYGLCGEGKGHATRSLVAVEHLERRGHEVLAAASGQAYPMVAKAHPRSLEIVGLSMRCEGGALDLAGSVELNARRLPEMLARNAAAWSEAEAFRPEAVVTDFDSFAWLFANAKGLPVVSFDNAQILPRCEHESWLWDSRHGDGLRALDFFVQTKAPSAAHYIITSFFYPPVKSECLANTTVIPPVLRQSVLDKLTRRDAGGDRGRAAQALAGPNGVSELGLDDGRADAQASVPGRHVLVYKTASLDDASFLGALGAVPSARFVVYGCAEGAVLPGNCKRRPFSEAGFIDDLARSRAVIGNAGMSLLGEALAFGKPLYAVPVRGQFEQVLNACYLEKLGYGAAADALEPRGLEAFLERVPTYACAIQAHPQHDRNARLFATLDGLFPPAAKGERPQR